MDNVKPYLERLSKMKTERYTHESAWQDAADYGLPKRDFTVSRTPGQKRTTKLYDSTAIHATEQLAGALHGMLTPPSGKWFFLRARGPYNKNPEVRSYLDYASDVMFDVFSSHEGSFATAAFEYYLDLVAFGSAAMSATFKDGRIMFQTEQLASCYTMENENGRNDIIYLVRKLRPIEMVRRFGKNVHEKVTKAYEGGQSTTFEVLQAIEPRDEHYGRGAAKDKKPYKSCFIDVSNKHLMLEEGFDDFPFMFARWSKRSGEAYGYGPLVAAISEIKQLNVMVEIMTRAAAKNVDPPLLSPAEGVILPLRLDPSSITFYNPDLPEPKFWQNGFQPNYFDALIEKKRELIMKMFYVDWLNLPLVDRMTQMEVNQRTQDSLRQLSPMLSRLASEFLSPLINRTFSLMIDNGLIDKPPVVARGVELAIEYISPIAIAQKAVASQSVLQGLSIGAQLAQFDPSVVSMIKTSDVYRDQLLNTYAWPQAYIHTEEEMEEIKAAQQEQAAMAQQAQIAESYSKSAANVAGAMKDTGGMV